MNKPTDNKEQQIDELDAQIARTADPIATDRLYRERDKRMQDLLDSRSKLLDLRERDICELAKQDQQLDELDARLIAAEAQRDAAVAALRQADYALSNSVGKRRYEQTNISKAIAAAIAAAEGSAQ